MAYTLIITMPRGAPDKGTTAATYRYTGPAGRVHLTLCRHCTGVLLGKRGGSAFRLPPTAHPACRRCLRLPSGPPAPGA